MKNILLIGYYIFGVILIGYIAIWWGLIEPIMNIAEMVDSDLATATGIAWEICKIFLREIVTGIVAFLLFMFGGFLTKKVLF